MLPLKCSWKTQMCREVLQKPRLGKPSLQQDLRNSKLDFPGLPIQHKPLVLLCDQLHWNNRGFYPLYTCYHLLLLTSLVLKFDPIAAPVACKSSVKSYRVVWLAGTPHAGLGVEK